MLYKYTEYTEHILADYGQCIRRAKLPIGVNDGGKEKKRKKKRKGGS